MDRSLGTTLLLLTTLVGVGQAIISSACDPTRSLHDQTIPRLEGGDFKLSDYKGKVLILMNMATYWGLHWFNSENMNALIEKVNSPNLQVIVLPCNQFGLQEPGMNDEIYDGIQNVRPGEGFIPKYELSAKIEVNGDDALQTYKILRDQCSGTVNVIGNPSRFYWSPITKDDIIWNFEKFLINPDGFPIRRYQPTFNAQNMYDDIMELMKQIPSAEKQSLAANLKAQQAPRQGAAKKADKLFLKDMYAQLPKIYQKQANQVQLP